MFYQQQVVGRFYVGVVAPVLNFLVYGLLEQIALQIPHRLIVRQTQIAKGYIFGHRFSLEAY